MSNVSITLDQNWPGSTVLKSGEYWIGDPFFVFHNEQAWGIINNRIDDDFPTSCVVKFDDNVSVFHPLDDVESLKDYDGYSYSTHSGMISIIPVSVFDIFKPIFSYHDNGRFVSFDEDFEVIYDDDSTMIFGDITISSELSDLEYEDWENPDKDFDSVW